MIGRDIALAVAAASLLTACIGGGGSGGRAPAAPPPASERAYRQCLADLTAATVRYDALEDRKFDGGCQAIGSVKLLDLGVPVTNLGAMTCPLARTFANWAYYAVLPAARRHLGQEVVRIETFGTYSCRAIAGRADGRLSEHAYANAVDVSGFVLADGTRVSVLDDWGGGTEAERAFLRAVHGSACKRFRTVLGPNYNAAHANHFHFDLGPNRFCR